MDAIKFLKEKSRMCYSFSGAAVSGCDNCPLNPCNVFEEKHPEQAVSTIEKWVKENPVQTNADKFEEVFGGRGETIAHCMGFQFGLWDKWLDAPYEEPKEDNE